MTQLKSGDSVDVRTNDHGAVLVSYSSMKCAELFGEGQVKLTIDELRKHVNDCVAILANSQGSSASSQDISP